MRPHVESAVGHHQGRHRGFRRRPRPPGLGGRQGPGQHRSRRRPRQGGSRDAGRPRQGRARTHGRPGEGRTACVARLLGRRRARAEAAAQAKEAADARVATLRGEEPPKKGGKLKKFALFAAVAGAVGFVAKKLQGGKQDDNWQSSYVPKPAPPALRPR